MRDGLLLEVSLSMHGLSKKKLSIEKGAERPQQFDKGQSLFHGVFSQPILPHCFGNNTNHFHSKLSCTQRVLTSAKFPSHLSLGQVHAGKKQKTTCYF